MSWRDDLRPASFRGVPFSVRSDEVTTGRRVHAEAVGGVRLPSVQDLGEMTDAAQRHVWFVVGDDYAAARDALIRAVRLAGPGELVDPYHGRILVQIGAVTVTHGVDSGGGYCEFGVEAWLASDEATARTASRTTAAGLVTSTTAAATSAQADASTAYAAAQAVTSERAALQRLGAGLSRELARIYEVAGLDAEAVTYEVAGLLEEFAGLEEGTIDAALEVAAGIVVAVGGVSELARLSVVAIDRLIRWIGIDAACRIATSTTYSSADSAEHDAAAIVEAIAALEGTESTPPETLAAAEAARVGIVQVLTARAARLPRLAWITLAEPIPAVVLSQRLYGTAARADQIVALNDVADPSRMVGRLRVLASPVIP